MAELIASVPVPIVSMCVFRGSLLKETIKGLIEEVPGPERLFVATSEGVFERGGDGVFRECRFERLEDKDAT